MAFSENSRDDKPYYLPLLIIISFLSHFPFVLKGFGEIDATKIAVSVIDMLNSGSDAAFANFYFTDVVPLYVAYLSWFMKLLNNDYSYLPVVMNYTNAVIGTLIAVPAFYLVKKIFASASVAFCSVLALIFAPSFYQSTIMGFPHLIALFFLLISLYYFICGLEQDRQNRMYSFMALSALFLTTAFLFKSDIVLIAGIYFGLLVMRKIKDRSRITSTFMVVFISGILFLVLRNVIMGPSSGTTMSKEGLSKWANFSVILPWVVGYYIAQAKPIAYGAGIATFCIGGVSFIYYLARKRADILVFILSWAALPTVFWLIMIGNNARHNMTSVLPILVIIVMFFHEKAPKYSKVLTIALIAANFLITAPSFSILKPSGSLFKSTSMLKERMNIFKERAIEIASYEEEKVAVLGTYHNPHVIMELMQKSPDYEAYKMGREDYKVVAGGKEYYFIYFVVVKPEDMEEGINYILNEYNLHDHVFVSVNYDLAPLRERGLKTKEIEIIPKAAL